MGKADVSLNVKSALFSGGKYYARTMGALLKKYHAYTDTILNEIAKVTDKTAREEVEAIKAEAENQKIGGTGYYIKGITYRRSKRVKNAYDASNRFTQYSRNNIEAIIYNKNLPWLATLLEYGHDVVDRHGITVGHAKAYPHFKPNEEKFNEIYVQRIVEAIRNHGGQI